MSLNEVICMMKTVKSVKGKMNVLEIVNIEILVNYM